MPLHIHLSETLLEVEESRRKHGMPGVPYIRKHGLFDAKVLAAHCVHVDEGEIRALKNFGAGVAHNPTQQPEAGRRRRAGHADARARRQRRHRHRRRGVEQRPRHVRGDAAGRAAGQGHHRRSRPRCPPATRWRWRRGSARRRCTSDHLTGSLEAGKRADLIVLDVSGLHNLPAFARDPGGIYARIVYTSKSTDVVDVMCNGRWLMRDRDAADRGRRRGDARGRRPRAPHRRFLGSREVSVLQKLVAVGGAVEQESFEVQVKARLDTDGRVLEVLAGRELTVIRSSRYRQHDIYWSFDDPDQGRLRYRDDEFLDDGGEVTGERSRLTLTGAHARGPLRRGAAVPLALSRAGGALGALLSRVLPAGGRARRDEGAAALAGRLPRRRVLRPPRSAARAGRPTATSSRSSRGPGRSATRATRRRSSPSCSRSSARRRTRRIGDGYVGLAARRTSTRLR